MHSPLIILSRVLHIGTLDPADLGKNSGASSQEGRCLSVSLCPNAWQQIARLGGYPVHELTCSGGTFLDVHAVQNDQALLTAVLDWAGAKQLVQDRSLWKAWQYDDELECWRYILSASKQAAFEEADIEGVYDHPDELPGPGDRPGLECVTVPVATAMLQTLTGMPCGPETDSTDAAIVAWAMEQLPELIGRPVDGLWWRETYDPDGLSAPRGAIFPSRVPEWAARVCDLDAVDDDSELEATPETGIETVSRHPAPASR